jgi:hypothetical protein
VIWAGLLAALLTADALAYPLLGMSMALCFLALAGGLAANFRRSTPGLPSPPIQMGGDARQRRWTKRSTPDREVLVALALAGLLPTVAGLVGLFRGHGLVGPVPELGLITTPAALFAGVIYASTLIDWYWILPQISGIVREPPCRPSPRYGVSHRSWGSVTRIWQAQRWITAVLGIVVGTATIVCLMLAVLYVVFVRLEILKGTAAASYIPIIAAVLPILGGLGIMTKGLSGSLGPVSILQQNPVIAVGDLVRYSGSGRSRVATEHYGQRDVYYVVDVSMELVKLKHVQSAELYGGHPFWLHKHDILVKNELVATELTTLNELWSGCVAQCSGVNWYCDNNLRRDRYLASPPQPVATLPVESG